MATVEELRDLHAHDWTDIYVHECKEPGIYEPCNSCEECGYSKCDDCGEFVMDIDEKE